jgi:hypothetical protein
LEVRRIRSGASRDRHGDAVWLDFMAPHRHLVVGVTVISARTNTNDPRIGARLPLHGSLALGAQHGKLDADLRTCALLGTPSVQSIHDYYPFTMEGGGRLAHMAVELVGRLAILVAVLRFPGMDAADSQSLRCDCYVRMQHFVRRTTYVSFRCFLGDVRRQFMQRLHVVIHGTLGSYLREALQEGSDDAVVCSSGLGFSLFSSFGLVASTTFSCKKLTLNSMMLKHGTKSQCLQSAGGLHLPKVLMSYIFCSQGSWGPIRTLIEGNGREGGKGKRRTTSVCRRFIKG